MLEGGKEEPAYGYRLERDEPRTEVLQMTEARASAPTTQAY